MLKTVLIIVVVGLLALLVAGYLIFFRGSAVKANDVKFGIIIPIIGTTGREVLQVHGLLFHSAQVVTGHSFSIEGDTGYLEVRSGLVPPTWLTKPIGKQYSGSFDLNLQIGDSKINKLYFGAKKNQPTLIWQR